MRILFVIDSLNIGGAEILLVGMLKAFQQRGHEQHVAYFTDGPLRANVEQLEIAVHRLSTRGLKDVRVVPRALRLVRTIQPDVVHTHLSKSDAAGQFAAALQHVPVRVSTIHNTDPWRENPVFSRLMGLITRGCQRHIAVTPTVCDHAMKWSRFPADKVMVIDNGVDLAVFDPATVTPAPLDLPENAGPIIGIVGRLTPQKNHSLFLRSARHILSQQPDAQFVIIGDGELRADLEAERAEFGLSENVHFTGNVSNIPEMMAALDLVVFTSSYEGLPVAMLEAMAMQRPIVSTRVGGIPEVITHQQNGVLVDAHDAETFASACLNLLANRSAMAALGQAARETVRARYSVSAMHQQILDLYGTLRGKD